MEEKQYCTFATNQGRRVGFIRSISPNGRYVAIEVCEIRPPRSFYGAGSIRRTYKVINRGFTRHQVDVFPFNCVPARSESRCLTQGVFVKSMA
jgi:hypothetical protein